MKTANIKSVEAAQPIKGMVPPFRPVTVGGVVKNRPQLMGPGGEVPPGGSFLVLDKPLTVEGRNVTEIKLPEERLEGERLVATGVVQQRFWGGVETRGGVYYVFDDNATLERNVVSQSANKSTNPGGDLFARARTVFTSSQFYKMLLWSRAKPAVLGKMIGTFVDSESGQVKTYAVKSLPEHVIFERRGPSGQEFTAPVDVNIVAG